MILISYSPSSEEESSLVVITERSRILDFPTNNFNTKQSNIDRMATALITNRKVGKSLAICRISENKSVHNFIIQTRKTFKIKIKNVFTFSIVCQIVIFTLISTSQVTNYHH